MSFEERDDCFVWRCDEGHCDHFAAFKPHDFMDCVDELKMRGWGFIPPERGEYGGDWTHQCPKHRRRLADVLNMTFGQASAKKAG
jgi:hypothetical protein